MLCIVIFHLPIIASGDDCPKATPIFQDEIATCDGVILQEAKVKKYLNLNADTKALQEKLSREQSMRKRKMEVCREKMEAADSRISELENPPWWKTAKFNRYLGFLGGVVVSVAALWAFQ